VSVVDTMYIVDAGTCFPSIDHRNLYTTVAALIDFLRNLLMRRNSWGEGMS
jgi:hypothetical protein